ncbi:MAG: hypothetical protein ACTHK5_14185 [Tsuneonella sp.]
MNTTAAERFVDVVLEDGWIAKPANLLSAMRAPSGRNPAATSREVADALSALDDTQALSIIKATLDAAYFSVLNLLDADMKNSGIEIEIATETDRWKSNEITVSLHELYRDRVEPNGSVRKPS